MNALTNRIRLRLDCVARNKGKTLSKKQPLNPPRILMRLQVQRVDLQEAPVMR